MCRTSELTVCLVGLNLCHKKVQLMPIFRLSTVPESCIRQMAPRELRLMTGRALRGILATEMKRSSLGDNWIS